VDRAAKKVAAVQEAVAREVADQGIAVAALLVKSFRRTGKVILLNSAKAWSAATNNFLTTLTF